MIACSRSLASPAAIGELVRHAYGLEVVSCTLIRSLVNDVYEVCAPGRRYVLKVYDGCPGAWLIDEVVWEQELATCLARSGVPVAPVVPLSDGRLAGELVAPEGSRPYALTEFVEGTTPQPPFDDLLYQDLGHVIARLHQANATFSSAHDRRPLDLELTLDQPLRLVLPRLADRPDQAQLVRELGAEARRRVTELATRGLAWGIRHGDVSPDNTVRTDRGLVLYDFDCAGMGWQAADLVGVRATPHWDAFLAGYQRVRELPKAELAALPCLRVVELIWNLEFHLVRKPALFGTASVAEGWVDRELASLRHAANQLGRREL